jgi:L-ascorbate metabolism protein UlaG (beta-lactamase superfamily)
MVDIVIVPVGNSGYTLDAVGALRIIKQIEPKVVIATHYADKGIKYEMPQVELEDALKNLGMEVSDTLDKYKYKPSEQSDSTKLVILNR